MRSRWRWFLYVSIVVMIGSVVLFYLSLSPPHSGKQVAVPLFIAGALCYVGARIAMFVEGRRP